MNMSSSATVERRGAMRRIPGATADYLLRQGILKLLAIKDSDIRSLTLEQCRDAVDKGLHSGGAFSATIPLVALYYGGGFYLDNNHPPPPGDGMFTSGQG